jgi:hypothetical protein
VRRGPSESIKGSIRGLLPVTQNSVAYTTILSDSVSLLSSHFLCPSTARIQTAWDIKVVRSKVRISDDLIALVNHYYNVRNKLVHERTTADISDRDRSAVQSVLKTLFELDFDS